MAQARSSQAAKQAGARAEPSATAVIEGSTQVAATDVNAAKGPGRRAKGLPFYNPGMALNRDLSVLLVAAEVRAKGRGIDVADALAGTGARSLRIANEVPRLLEPATADGEPGGHELDPLLVHANDGNPGAVAAIEAGIAANGLGAVRVTNADAHAFLASQRFDVVDLDPHGSPMPFADAALRATRPDGLLCATATDTGALAGTFPRVARRRYDAHHGLRATPWQAEVGLRMLAGALVRAAARADRAAHPVLCVSHGHWMRVVVRLDGARQEADGLLRQLRAAVPDERGAGRFLGEHERPPDGPHWAGPLWSGPLHDAAFVRSLRDVRPRATAARQRELDALLPMLQEEAAAPPFWIVPDRLQARLGHPVPRRDRLLERLRGDGWAAARTHMDPQGIRTDAPLDALARLWAAPAES